MKKVKIMLVSALAIAAIGGALAFKAQKGPGMWCGETTEVCSSQGLWPCEFTYQGVTPQNQVTGVYCSTVQNGSCTTVRCVD